MRNRRLLLLVGIAITIWQFRAGLERCGTIDGGILIVPLAVVLYSLIKGVTRDLYKVFRETRPLELNDR